MLVCSRACAYAVKALVRLAREGPGAPLKARAIAAKENIPYAFLAKVLHQLVRAGIVSSSPGLTGGFRLRVPASKVALIDVVKAVDGLGQFRQCFTGIAECNEASPCPMHASWEKVRSEILRYLRETTLAQVAEAWSQKERYDLGAVRTAGAAGAAGIAVGTEERGNGAKEGTGSLPGEEVWDVRQPLD
jgi:Rrf2 family iron-sulfur cluster assembly transcriptional regulator